MTHPAAAIDEQMRGGRYAAAADAARRLLDAQPGQPQALYRLAVCRRYLGELDAAAKALDELQAAAPDFARLWQERGHLAKARGDRRGALGAYREAVRRDDALVASWRGLAALGSGAARREAAAWLRYLAALPAPLLSARGFNNSGRAWQAERLCRAFLARHPKHVEAMRLLAAIGLGRGVLDDAEFLLESAVAFAPDDRGALVDYINVLHKRQKFGASLTHARRLLARDPANPASRLICANQAMAAGDYDAALQVYDEVLAAHPHSRVAGDEKVHLTRGHALKTAGRLRDAIAAYRHAARLRPDFGDAWWSLANLKVYRFEARERERLATLADAPGTATEDRVHLLFALGKALEDAADYAGAFARYERGNAVKRRQLRYDPHRMTRRLGAQREVCDRAFFRARAGGGSPAPAPIFVVGLPRAGSTLIEQILASHSAVDGTLELHHIGSYAAKLDGRRRQDEPPRYPAALRDLDAAARRALGERYLQETRLHRRGAPRFVDKMPNNFRHLGLIHLILPNAKIIDARRDALACCFSNFKQLFASGQEFSYSLADLGAYYRDYVALMAHWEAALPPGRILRVHHEDVVEDLEGQVRRLLDHLELPFEAACLRYWETPRSIRTPSSEQVRQPINRDGLYQWRRFERWLGPLKDALGVAPAGDVSPPRATTTEPAPAA